MYRLDQGMGQQSSAEAFEEPRETLNQSKMSYTPSRPFSYKNRKSSTDLGPLNSGKNIYHSTPVQNPAKITGNLIPSTSQAATSLIDDTPKQHISNKTKILDESTLKCGICNTEFDTRAAAYRHRREIHPDARKKHIIVKLAKKTKIPPQQKTRKKSNKRDEQNCQPRYLRRYKCQVCEKIFKTNYAKWNHRDDHHPELKNKKIFEKIFVLDNNRSREPKPKPSRSETETEERNTGIQKEGKKVATKRKSVEIPDVSSKKPKHANEQFSDATIGITAPSEINSRRRRDQNNFENSIENKRHEIYQCALCKLHFVTVAGIKRHIKSCKGAIESSSRCRDCELLFCSGELALHQSKGHIVGCHIEFDVVQISRQEKVNKRHHCSQCDIHFTRQVYYDDHVSQNHEKQRVLKCKYCGLKFCKRSFLCHVKYQHTDMIISRKNHHTTHNSVGGVTIVNPAVQKPNKNTDGMSNTRDNNRSDTTIQTPDCEKRRRNTIDLYKCNVCSVHFLEKSYLVRHISLDQHDAEVKLPCRHCGLLFSQNNYKKHEKLHHVEITTLLEDFNILSLDQYKNAVSSNKGNIVTSQKTKFGLVTIPDQILNEDKILYRCAICNVHYTMKSSLAKHMKKGTHIVKTKVPCGTCGLIFTAASLTDHTAAHHGELKIQSADEFLIKSFGEGPARKILIQKTGNVTIAPIQNTEIHHEDKNVALEEKKTSNINNNPKCNEENRKTETIYKAEIQNSSKTIFVQNVIANQNSITNGTVSGNTKVGKPVDGGKCTEDAFKANASNKRGKVTDIETDFAAVKEFFKCKQCEVFFMKATSLCKHVLEHRVLQPWEYIECPECNLQFLCAELPDHRQSIHSATNRQCHKINPHRILVTEVEKHDSLTLSYRRYYLNEDTQLYIIEKDNISAETQLQSKFENAPNFLSEPAQHLIFNSANVTTLQINNEEAYIDDNTNNAEATEYLETTAINKTVEHLASESELVNASETWYSCIEIENVGTCVSGNGKDVENIPKRIFEVNVTVKTFNEVSEDEDTPIASHARTNNVDNSVVDEECNLNTSRKYNDAKNNFEDKIKNNNANSNTSINADIQLTEQTEQTKNQGVVNLNESYNSKHSMMNSETGFPVEYDDEKQETTEFGTEINTEANNNEETNYPLRYTDSTETLHLEPLDHSYDCTEFLERNDSLKDTENTDEGKKIVDRELDSQLTESPETDTVVNSIDIGILPRCSLVTDVNGNSKDNNCNLTTNDVITQQGVEKINANCVEYSETTTVLSNATGDITQSQIGVINEEFVELDDHEVQNCIGHLSASGNNEKVKNNDPNTVHDLIINENIDYSNSDRLRSLAKSDTITVEKCGELEINNTMYPYCSTRKENQQNDQQNTMLENADNKEDVHVDSSENYVTNEVYQSSETEKSSEGGAMLNNNQESTLVQIENTIEFSEEMEVDECTCLN